MTIQTNGEKLRMLRMMIEDTNRGMCIYQASTEKKQRLIADDLKSDNRKQTLIIDMADFDKHREEIPTDIQGFKQLLDRAPQAQTVIVCNLQLCGLWMGDTEYIGKLNFMRDQLMECNKMWVFGMTPYFSILLSRQARDFYTYIMYNCPFITSEDEDRLSYRLGEMYSGDVRLKISAFEEYRGYVTKQMEGCRLDGKILFRVLQCWYSCSDYLDYDTAEWVRELTDIIDEDMIAKWPGRSKQAMYMLLAKVHRKLKNFQKAIWFMQVGQELAQELFAPESPEIAEVYEDMTRVYLEAGMPEQAKEYGDKATQAYRRQGKEYSLDTVNLWEHIALLAMEDGRYEEAVQIHRNNIRIIMEESSESDYRLFAVYNNLGKTYKEMGEIAEIPECFQKLGELFSKYHAGNREIIIIMGFEMAEKAYWCGLRKTAEQALVKIRGLCEQFVGEEHPYMAEVYFAFADIHTGSEEWAFAEENFKKSISIYKAVYGDTHVRIANACRKIGVLYTQQHVQEKMEAAYQYIINALEIYERIYPGGHREAADAFVELGQVHYENGDFDNAIVCLEEANRICGRLGKRDEQFIRDNERRMGEIRLEKEGKSI